MSQYLDKSNQSLSSAEILNAQQYYSSTVNRAYYGYFQFLMYILFEKLKTNRDEFDEAAEKSHEGTHVRASNMIQVLLQNKVSSQKYKWFQNTNKELKMKRVSADYYNVITTPDDCNKSIAWANELIECVKQNVL